MIATRAVLLPRHTIEEAESIDELVSTIQHAAAAAGSPALASPHGTLDSSASDSGRLTSAGAGSQHPDAKQASPLVPSPPSGRSVVAASPHTLATGVRVTLASFSHDDSPSEEKYVVTNDDLRKLQRELRGSVVDRTDIEVAISAEVVLASPNSGSAQPAVLNDSLATCSAAGGLPAVAQTLSGSVVPRALDDLDAAAPLAQSHCNLPSPAFDVNRSYTNDGRHLTSSRAYEQLQRASNAQMQSLPTCGSVVVGSQLQRKRQRVVQATRWRFRKEMVIGAGADGKVFLAVDLDTNERIAVKEILISPGAQRTLQEAQEDSRKIAMVKRQIVWLQRLPSHPNVVRHLGAERTTCALIVSMEFVAGGSIAALLSKLGPFNEKVVRLYAKHVCAALAFLHSQGVIHRDIKGANCLIGVDGVAKVCDFGCCIVKDLVSSSGNEEFVKGIHGTSMWMSPECIQQKASVDSKTDIWSLGCMVVEMATGKPPWHEAHFTNEWAAMFHISQAKRGPPIPPHLSRQAHDFLRRCFAVNPVDRPSAEECLAMPFLTEEFQPTSSDSAMNPPTPCDQDLPFGPATSSSSNTHGTLESSQSDYDTSTYSSLNHGCATVFDQEWADAEAAVGDDEPLDHALFQPTRSDRTNDAVGGEMDTTLTSSSETVKSQVSLEVIDTFLRGTRSSMVPQGAASSATASMGTSAAAALLGDDVGDTTGTGIVHDLDDHLGIGLPEPILYNVFSFLDAQSLCRTACVSRSLQELVDVGAKEMLWRAAFIAEFGTVDVVQLTLRKGWKTYYKNSVLHRNIVLDGKYRLLRQRGQSDRVFEAVDLTVPLAVANQRHSLQTLPVVIVKFEKWHNVVVQQQSNGTFFGATHLLSRHPQSASVSLQQPQQPQRVNSSGNGGPPSSFRVPSPSRGEGASFGSSSTSSRLPSLTKTPTKSGRPPAGHFGSRSGSNGIMPPAGSFSPHKEPRRDGEAVELRPPAILGISGSLNTSVNLTSGGGGGSNVTSKPPLARISGPAERTNATSPSKGTSGGRHQGPTVVLPTAAPASSAPPAQPQGSSAVAFHATHSGAVTAPPLSQHQNRGRMVPRPSRLPSPSQFTLSNVSTASRRTQSPAYRDGSLSSAPAHFVFLQPSQLYKSASDPPMTNGVQAHSPQDSPESNPKERGERRDDAALAPPVPTASAGAHHATVKGGWHEIYEFQRTVELAPLVAARPLAHRSLLQQDFRFLRHLEALGARCVPRLLAYEDGDTELQRNALVTSMLGPSLNELLLFCGNQLTLRTLSLLTLRLLDALEEIHDRDVVHGNISPTNIAMGGPGSECDVFLLNFAHARFFRDPRTHRPNNTSTSSASAERAKKQNNEFISFCSTFVQRRCTAAPRDDVIALGYVLCYLFHGGLPWTRERTLNAADVLRQKSVYLESLQRTPPIQLHYFLKSGYALRQGEVPDYRYLKSLVLRMMEERHWEDDGVFDWTGKMS